MKNKIQGVWAPTHATAGFDGDNFNFLHTDEEGNLRVKVLYFNPANLSWEAATGPTIGGSVTGVGETPTLAPSDEAVKMYEDGDNLYVCKAPMGSSLSSAVWQIKKVNTGSGVVVSWCDGNANYDNVATDLSTVKGLSYS